ncbi:GAF domain-containing protein [Leptolyngbya sp. FACHB-1515]
MHSSGMMLAALSQVDRPHDLVQRVRDLPVPQFANLLDQITKEFEYFLRAIELINNDALETMLEQILEAFTLKIGEILEADRTTIFLVDEEKQQLWSKIAQSQGNMREIRLPMNMGIAGRVAATGTPLNIPDAYSSPLFNPDIDRETGYVTRNILCMPIFSSKNRVVAVVQLLNKAGDRLFDSYDEHRFREFAHSIGVILESCNSFYIAARNQRGAAALRKATASLAQSLDLEKTLQVVMDEARELMLADRSTLFLLDRDRNELWSKVATLAREIRIPATKGIAGYVASTGRTLNIPHAYEDPRFDPSTDRSTGYRTRNILCMPVFNSEKELIGVTQLINKHQGSFTTSDEEFMEAFNVQAGIALQNAQLFESVLQERQYQKDMLQSLSDAVISTDMQGQIVTINDAALTLLGCPATQAPDEERDRLRTIWRDKLIKRSVWEVVPILNLRGRLETSLQEAKKLYEPEQSLLVGLWAEATEADGTEEFILAVRDRSNPNQYLPWNLPADQVTPISKTEIREMERSINLTINPLTTPSGNVQGGLIVIEDISREKRMKAAMRRYISREVADLLDDDALTEGRREVSILFSDIRGYTSITENLEASEVVSLLNNYFETMVEAVFNYEGTLDKFMGDALMAVYGAPLLKEDHAWMSVQSALDMRRRLREFNEHPISDSQPFIRIGIGISSGEVVCGNIGHQQRMDYTVIGDGVDISSRLEGVTKEYGCDIILSEHTYELCREHIWVRELDRIRVKGKRKSIAIYELIGDRRHALDLDTQDFLELYQNGRTAYQKQNFRQAIRYFETAAKLRPNDRAVQTHLDRANAYLISPPDRDWDGVYTMTSK